MPAMPTPRAPLYRRHRFPPEVICYAVWLYFRFPLSLRMVEEMLAERGICVTYETVRQWGKKFGKAFSDQIRRRAPARGDKWHLDEVVVSIAGQQCWLWRAVDQHGFVLVSQYPQLFQELFTYMVIAPFRLYRFNNDRADVVLIHFEGLFYL